MCTSYDGGVEEDFAERVTRRFFQLCENPRTRRPILRFVSMTLVGGKQSRLLYGYLNKVLFGPLTGPAGLHVSTVRLQLASTTLAGFAVVRYKVKLEPLASMPVEELVRTVVPAVRGCLMAEPTGEIPAWDAGVSPYPRTEWATLDARRQFKLTGRSF